MLKKQYVKSKAICKVTFSLPKAAVEGANEVKVLGDFNNWSWEKGVAMKGFKTEYKATIELPVGQDYAFRYLTDQNRWENDWAADAYNPSPYTGIDNSIVVVENIATTKAPAKKKTTTPAKKKSTTPAKKKVAKATKTEKDNLKKIEGIGPKIEKLLNERGILSFGNLAKAKNKLLQEILKEAGSRFKMHDPTTWPEQAALAAKGQWDKLNILQDELKGGKRK